MSLVRKSAFASLIQVAITLGNLVFAILMANYYGASPEMDSYVVIANIMMLLTSFMYVVHQQCMIPYLGGIEKDKDEKVVFRSLVRFNNKITTIIAVCLLVLSDLIVRLLAPGFSHAQWSLASLMLRISAFLIVLTNIQGMAKAYAEFQQRPYFTQTIEFVRVSLLIVFIFFCHTIAGVLALPCINLIALLIVLLLYYLNSSKIPFSFGRQKGNNTDVQKYLLLIAPIVLGQVVVWVIRLSDTYLASYLPAGALSHLSYAQRLVNNFSQLFSGVIIVYIPIVMGLQKSPQDEEHRKVVLEGFTHLFFFAFTISLFVVVYAHDIIELFYQRGIFTAQDTGVVAKILQCYGLMLLGAPLGGYLAAVYYGRQAAKQATIYSIISSMVNLALNLVLISKFEAYGLAMAASFAFAVGNGLFIWKLPTINSAIYRTPYLVMMGKCVIAGILPLAVLHSFQASMVDYPVVVRIAIMGFLYLVGVLASAVILRIETARVIARRLKSYLS